MRITAIVILFLLTATKSLFSQTLYINEISQGPSGNKEYVEFIVVGETSCTAPTSCLDMRGKIIDDNNGYFASGSGTGIAQGAVRFANTSFWECIPIGTIIVIYNNSDRNGNLPADDVNSNDGNFLLVIPGNSNLLEKHTTIPSNSQLNYSGTGWTTGGNWQSTLAMAGGNDSFQIRESLTSPGPTHAVSWGNNSQNNIIYFAGSASGKVFSMTNTISDNPSLQANWTSESAPAGETPGQPNNPANAAWINALRNGTVSNNVTIAATKVDTGCGAGCTGSINITPSGGSAPYTYVWNNNATTQNLSSLCAGTYEVEVTDALGCSQTETINIASVGATINIVETITNESCDESCDGVVNVSANGGTAPYTYAWSNGATTANLSSICDGSFIVTVTDNSGCSATKSITVAAGPIIQMPTITPVADLTLASNIVTLNADATNGTWSGNGIVNNTFNPAVAGVGTHQICYTVGTAPCAQTACITIIVTEGCVTQNYDEAITVCPGQTITFDGQQISTAGNYAFTYQNIDGCDSIVNLNFSFFSLNPIINTVALCLGDSTEVNGFFYAETQIVNYETVDNNGCILQNTVTINVTDCNIPPYSVFVPNTFTPNGDAVNENLPIVIVGGVLLEGYIYNRWGEVVKSFHHDDLEWNGETQSGQQAPDGVYTYIVRIQKDGGVTDQLNGFITLVR